ncbi:hypothetical protein ACJX0J_031204, partial [Zea mays]
KNIKLVSFFSKIMLYLFSCVELFVSSITEGLVKITFDINAISYEICHARDDVFQEGEN